MLWTISLFVALAASAFAQNSVENEAQVWQLEKAYWEYVKANDLDKYRALWHENFLGWPFISSTPVRKDHITDWITTNTSKGIKLRSYSIEQLAIQVTGDVAVDYYRITATLGQRQRCRGQDRPIANHAHMDSRGRHVADHRRHVLASKCGR